MNCSEIVKLLPLYGAHDLSGRRERLITAHLELCRACARAAAEYGGLRELMPELTPPSFSDEFYAEIRRSVWRRIEAETKTSPFEFVLVWFRPRSAWTTAVAALLITTSAVGIFFVAKRSSIRPDVVAENPTEVVLHGNGSAEARVIGPAEPGEKIPRPRQVNVPKRGSKPGHRWAPDRAGSLIARSPDAQVTKTQPSSPIIGTENLDLASRASGQTLRMEIQTKNPNIRIIWFAQ